MSIKSEYFIRMPLSEITTPKSGYICSGPMWWHVTEQGDVLFYKTMHSPQCNSNKSIVERIKCADIKTTPVFIEMAYLPHDCHDYV